MLEFTDAILVFVFSWIFQIIFVLASIAGVIAALVALVSNIPFTQKLHWIGVCLVMLSVTMFYFGWLGEETWTPEDQLHAKYSNPSFPDYSFLPAVGCAFFALLTLVVPLFLRAVGVPMIITGSLYMGIAMFGI
jgi:hypothetical protein